MWTMAACQVSVALGGEKSLPRRVISLLSSLAGRVEGPLSHLVPQEPSLALSFKYTVIGTPSEPLAVARAAAASKPTTLPYYSTWKGEAVISGARPEEEEVPLKKASVPRWPRQVPWSGSVGALGAATPGAVSMATAACWLRAHRLPAGSLAPLSSQRI